jgi:hypothetical protein
MADRAPPTEDFGLFRLATLASTVRQAFNKGDSSWCKAILEAISASG